MVSFMLLPEEDMSQRADRIRKAIADAGLSYGALSQITKIPKAALQRYATGVTGKIPIDRLEIIALHTGVSAAWLMGWTEDISPLENRFTLGQHVCVCEPAFDYSAEIQMLPEQQRALIIAVLEFNKKKRELLEKLRKTINTG
jgi:transcriptional regulator with XRE-family HTH domain